MTLAVVQQLLWIGGQKWAVRADRLLARAKVAVLANVIVDFVKI